MPFIDRIGLEIEGCWKGVAGVSPLTFPLKQDISVHAIEGKNYAHVGEASTPEPIRRSEAAEWLRVNWPTDFDTRCGMHAHISVVDPEKNYGRLADRAFFDLAIKRLEDWGKMMAFDTHSPYSHRLYGCPQHKDAQGQPLNRFCQRIFDPFKQMKQRTKDDHIRRSIFNYCWEMHGTLECRIWPMFTEGPKVAAQAVEVFFTAVEDFLAEVDARERKGLKINLGGTGLGRKITPQSLQIPTFDPWPAMEVFLPTPSIDDDDDGWDPEED